MMFHEDEIYGVSQFLSLCNKTIGAQIPPCWLQGEISNLVRAKSGHIYFSLKDAQSQVRCALFRLNQRGLKFAPEDGMEVLVNAAPTLYESRGDFQIIIRHLEPVGTGNLQLAFDQLKEKLSKEGLFDPSHKKPLPSVVRTIGVVSSSIGAVIQDIIQVLAKRYPFADILLFDSPVQGEVSEQLARALVAADQSRRCDVIILARGGGSLEDLWAFNEEALARTIFEVNTPVISAVGHETDTTIADFVADLRAPTPSAAAAMATPDRLALLTQIEQYARRINKALQQQLTQQQTQLNQLRMQLSSPEHQLNTLAQRLDRLNMALGHQIHATLGQRQRQLDGLSSTLKQLSPSSQINAQQLRLSHTQSALTHQLRHTLNQQQQKLHGLTQQLKRGIKTQLNEQKSQMRECMSALHHLSPLNTLSRGYSITTDGENRVLHSVKTLKPKQQIISRISDGVIYSQIDKIEKN